MRQGHGKGGEGSWGAAVRWEVRRGPSEEMTFNLKLEQQEKASQQCMGPAHAG